MKKTTLLVAGIILCLALFSACSLVTDAINEISGSSSSGGEYAFEDDAEKLSETTTYYNGFLGFSYTIPSGWWLYRMNSENFTAAAADSAAESLLDIFFGEDYDFIEMANIANLQYSSSDSHIGVYISAEKLEDVQTLDDYMDEYLDYMLEPGDGDQYTLAEEDTAEINGRYFAICVFDVDQENRPYRIITYTCEVNSGYFLTLLANYWPENRNALNNIRGFIEEGLEFI